MEQYKEFWRYHTSDVFSVTLLWGMLLAFPIAVTFFGLWSGMFNLGEILNPVVGEQNAYATIVTWLQMGMSGGLLLAIPAILRIVIMKRGSFFTAGATALYIATFGGVWLAFVCYEHLHANGVGSDDHPVFVGLVMTGVAATVVSALIAQRIKKGKT